MTNVVANPGPNSVVNHDQAVLPKVDYLKENAQIQGQVDNRVRELHHLNEQPSAGNFKSQRVGGNGDDTNQGR